MIDTNSPGDDTDNDYNKTDGIKSVIAVMNGPFHPSQLTGYWGQRPLLIRNAFSNETPTTSGWPCWDDIFQSACWNDVDNDICVERGESARLIRHIPHRLDSYDVEFGPFDPEALRRDMLGSNSKKSAKTRAAQPQPSYRSTLVVNDVDQISSSNNNKNSASSSNTLADWMDRVFGFLPRWRRDDAQVSLATKGGGIGPHVDNYDVFLIQTSGQRQWLIDATRLLTNAQEQMKLVPNIPVSILNFTDSDKSACTALMLEPTDMLYLPPRVVHWGTSLSDDCMTLSVGCRAPAAADFVTGLAEQLQLSVAPTAVQRYTEDCRNFSFAASGVRTGPTLNGKAKDAMKKLVQQAVEDILDNETVWDEIVGKLVTRTVRGTNIVGAPFSPGSSDYMDSTSEFLRNLLLSGSYLVRTPGISFATTRLNTTDKRSIDRIYANGDKWEVVDDDGALELFNMIANGDAIGGATFCALSSQQSLRVINNLFNEGILQLQSDTRAAETT